MTELVTRTIPPVTQEFLDELKKAFRPTEISPKLTHDEIIYQAGQQSVLKWIERTAVSVSRVSPPDSINPIRSPSPVHIVYNSIKSLVLRIFRRT